MRFMETYYGDIDTWTIGFKKTNDVVMQRLRAKYCYVILTSDVNQLKKDILKKASDFAKCLQTWVKLPINVYYHVDFGVGLIQC